MPPLAHARPAVNQSPLAALTIADDFDRDDWREHVAHKIAQRFAVPVSIATVIVDLLNGGRQ